MEKFATCKEVAEALGLTVSTINRLRKSGKIPVVIITPKVIRYDVEAVRGALNETRGVAPEPKKRGPNKAISFEGLTLPEHLDNLIGRDAVKRWLDYKACRGERYKSLPALTELFSKFHDEKTFDEAVRRSMANNWAGLFPEKNGTAHSRAHVAAAQNMDLIQRLKREDEPQGVIE